MIHTGNSHWRFILEIHTTDNTAQVLLLLEKHSGASGIFHQPLRPSRLVLHSNGRVTFVPSGSGSRSTGSRSGGQLATTLASEEELYCSPEEAEGPQGRTPQSRVFRWAFTP